MKKLLVVLSCAALIAGLSTAARAEVLDGYSNDDLTSFTVTSAGGGLYNFSFTGTLDSGSGVFTTSTTGTSGEFLITGVTGTTDGSTISSLFAAGTYPFLLGGGDNFLFFPAIINFPNTGAAYLDIFGLSYALANGKDVNLYYGQGQTGDPEVYDLLSGPITPEPASFLLLATGMLALGSIPFLRRRTLAASIAPRSA
jgi:hypothetical protein